MKTIFITGATGYMGTRLSARLLEQGCRVVALVRQESVSRLPAGVEAVVADAFDSASYQSQIPEGAVFVHLLGVRKPSPAKKDAFYAIDLPCLKAAADAAVAAGVERFVYLSVAQEPAAIMRDYQQVRAQGEQYCLEKGLTCVFIRPWYVLGPGHRWPVLLWPVYALLLLIPATRKKARALGFVTLSQMLNALVSATQMPLDDNPKIFEVREISGL